MKKALSVVMACLSVSLCSVSVFAAEEPRYVPLIPEFLDVGGGVNVNVPIDKSSDAVKEFFLDFYEQPYLIVLDQWTATSYYPQYGNTNVEQEWIGEDRRWSISFIRPNKGNASKHYAFTYYDPLVYRYTEPRPMAVQIDGSNSMTVLTYHYDFKTKRLDSGTLYQSVGRQYFSYVIGSADLSESVSFYPYYDKLAGEKFTVGAYVQGGILCPYNWWIGKKNIDNTIDPPKPPDPPIDPPDPPIDPPDPPDPPIPPDPPDFPDWGDMEPDDPLKPFDPSDPSDNGGYEPPKDDVYDPIGGLKPPPNMPDNPMLPPDLPDGGDDPFDPPTLPGGGDNPFDPPTLPGGGDDPFSPPTLPDGGDDPFNPKGRSASSGTIASFFRSLIARFWK